MRARHRRSRPMTCSTHNLPKGQPVQVNGVAIPRERIAEEIQHHPSRNPVEAWQAAARSLVVRELLLQEARRLGIAAEPQYHDDGRRETEEEARIRGLVEQ